jgi:hypothetical protein
VALRCDNVLLAQACLEFVERVYGIFGFEFALKLSTRPEKSMGEDADWYCDIILHFHRRSITSLF